MNLVACHTCCVISTDQIRSASDPANGATCLGKEMYRIDTQDNCRPSQAALMWPRPRRPESSLRCSTFCISTSCGRTNEDEAVSASFSCVRISAPSALSSSSDAAWLATTSGLFIWKNYDSRGRGVRFFCLLTYPISQKFCKIMIFEI